MSDTAAPEGATPEGSNGDDPQFGMQRIYVKDISFESPRSPEVFREEWKPRMKLDLNSRYQRLDEGLYEVVLTITVEARGADEQVGFIVELQQAGIFRVTGLDESRLQHTLSSFCPNILFPYARETIDSLVVKGSFPALMLAPVNFDALYAEALKRREGEAEAEGQGDVTH